MAHYIAKVVALAAKITLTEEQFRRTVRGREGLGYPTVSDDEIGRAYLVYMMYEAEAAHVAA